MGQRLKRLGAYPVWLVIQFDRRIPTENSRCLKIAKNDFVNVVTRKNQIPHRRSNEWRNYEIQKLIHTKTLCTRTKKVIDLFHFSQTTTSSTLKITCSSESCDHRLVNSIVIIPPINYGCLNRNIDFTMHVSLLNARGKCHGLFSLGERTDLM